MISNFSSSRLRSQQGEVWAPGGIAGQSCGGPGPGAPNTLRPSWAVPPPSLIKEQPVVTAATIYLIKMGYSGAILRYVNECYIIDIY